MLAAARMCVLPEGHANESHIPIVVQHSLSKHRMEWQTVVAASGTKILPACSHPAYVLHFGAVAIKPRQAANERAKSALIWLRVSIGKNFLKTKESATKQRLLDIGLRGCFDKELLVGDIETRGGEDELRKHVTRQRSRQKKGTHLFAAYDRKRTSKRDLSLSKRQWRKN